jgi:hypothetical protein
VRIRDWTLLLIFSALLVGCGESGASKKELHRAYSRGYAAGKTKARTEARARVHQEGAEERQREDEELEALELAYLEGEGLNPYPITKSGEPSYQFEPEDIERAEGAPQDVQEYCAGAVSDAQEIGCLSHEILEVP